MDKKINKKPLGDLLNNESLVRFIRHSGDFTKSTERVDCNVFMPNKNENYTTSVFRDKSRYNKGVVNNNCIIDIIKKIQMKKVVAVVRIHSIKETMEELKKLDKNLKITVDNNDSHHRHANIYFSKNKSLNKLICMLLVRKDKSFISIVKNEKNELLSVKN